MGERHFIVKVRPEKVAVVVVKLLQTGEVIAGISSLSCTRCLSVKHGWIVKTSCIIS